MEPALRPWSLLVVLAACAPAPVPAPPGVAAAVEPTPPPSPPSPPPPGTRLAARELRVTWAGAVGAPQAVDRSEDEARVLAADLHARATAGASFDALVAATSEAPSARRGGDLGPFTTPLLDPGLEAALASVPVGGLTPPVRTDAGYHLLRREPLDERVVRWVMFGWRGAHGASVARTRPEAQALAQRAAEALAAGAIPASLGADAAGPDAGERLGPHAWGPALIARVDALDPGEVGVVETPAGLVVVRREPTERPAAR